MNEKVEGRFGDVPVHTSESLAKRGQTGVGPSVKDMLKKREKQIRALLSGQLDPLKFATVAMTTIRSNEKLQECSPISLVTAIMMAAQRGLSLDPTLGHAYLVPYWNQKLGCREAQYQTGYQGKIFLAKRDGDVVVDTFVVYKNDTFTARRTTEGYTFEHVPTPLDQDPGESIGWVARAQLPDGKVLFEVMRRADVEKIRQTVKARYKKDTPAWSEWFDEMGRGKVVNRLAKYLPQSPMLQLDAAQESALDGGEAQVIEVEAEDGSLLPMVVPQALEEGEGGTDTHEKPAADMGRPAASQGNPVAAPQTAEANDWDSDTGDGDGAAQASPPDTKNKGVGPVSSRGALGAYICQQRKDAGITQAALAEGVQVSASLMGRIETGGIRPDPELVERIARYMALDPADLLAVGGYPRTEAAGSDGGVDGTSEPPADLFKLQQEADQHAPDNEE